MTPPPTRLWDSVRIDSVPSLSQHDDFDQVPLIVFSHLRWDFVTQRPQHLVSRLARTRQVYFVEEPFVESSDISKRKVVASEVAPNIQVIRPQVAGSQGEVAVAEWLLHQKELQNTLPILWFYSPAFISMANLVPSSVIVYDCMDELAAFKGASSALLTQERQLLNLADLVFTGGKSLYAAKHRLHPNVHCFPSSVDVTHFSQANDRRLTVPADIANLPHPRVGFYGVIDERLDTALLAEVAKQAPDITFIMIGPVVKIDPQELPQAPNLHYLGAREYTELPSYLKGFDCTFMPFALNDATRFISPTKTLEFMAAGKPIVSTPIRDVVSDYAHVISICHSAQEMVTAIRRYTRETYQEYTARVQLQQRILRQTSWHRTAQAMNELLAHTLAQKQQQGEWQSTTEFAFQPALTVAKS